MRRASISREAVADDRERQGDEGGEKRAENSHQKGVPKALEINGIPENLGDVIEGQLSVRSDKRSLQGPENRPDEKQRKECRGKKENDFGKGVRHGAEARRYGGISRKNCRGMGILPMSGWIVTHGQDAHATIAYR